MTEFVRSGGRPANALRPVRFTQGMLEDARDGSLAERPVAGVPAVETAGRRTGAPGCSARASAGGSVWSPWRCVTRAAVRGRLGGGSGSWDGPTNCSIAPISSKRSMAIVVSPLESSSPAQPSRRMSMTRHLIATTWLLSSDQVVAIGIVCFMSPRRSAADARRTRDAIVDRAVTIGSTDGLASLSFGRVAEDLAVTKSGVVRHFPTKEDLQLAALAEGRRVFRREQGRRHAERVAGIMAEAGFPAADCERVTVLLRKEGIKRDAQVQALEDVICFTFLRWYFQPFAEGRDPDALLKIVTKTARKMSESARARALTEFALPEPFAAAFRA